jgi:peroxiredoxin
MVENASTKKGHPTLVSPGEPEVAKMARFGGCVTAIDSELQTLDLRRGRLLPEVDLDSTVECRFSLRSHADLVIYMYPGASGLIRADETPLFDAVQHRAFSEHSEDFTACGFTIVGISSQSIHRQRRIANRNKLLHALMSDPDFRLAEALGLPTLWVGATRVYERLTLIVNNGRIHLALYALPTPERHAAHLVELLRRARQEGSRRDRTKALRVTDEYPVCPETMEGGV